MFLCVPFRQGGHLPFSVPGMRGALFSLPSHATVRETRSVGFYPVLEISRGTLIEAQPSGFESRKRIQQPHKKLCELLKARRKAAGLIQTVVAKRLGKPPPTSPSTSLGIGALTCWSSWTLPAPSASTRLNLLVCIEGLSARHTRSG